MVKRKEGEWGSEGKKESTYPSSNATTVSLLRNPWFSPVVVSNLLFTFDNAISEPHEDLRVNMLERDSLQ